MIGLALGLPAMGKTQALQDYVSAHALTHRFFTVDRTEDWKRGSPRWRGVKWKEWDTHHARLLKTVGPALARPLLSSHARPWFGDAPSPDRVRGWLETLPPCGVFRFGWPWEGLEVAQLVRDVGSTTYVDDEIDFTAVAGGWQSNPLRDFCHRGRHLPNAKGEVGEVHVLGAARRAQSLHIDMTTLADFIWVFRLKGARTLERLVDDNILPEADVPRVVQLPPTHFFFWQATADSSWGKLTPY